jgi:hypothetical protein
VGKKTWMSYLPQHDAFSIRAGCVNDHDLRQILPFHRKHNADPGKEHVVPDYSREAKPTVVLKTVRLGKDFTANMLFG